MANDKTKEQDLTSKLNAKMQGTGARFTKIDKESGQATIEITPNANQAFFATKEQVRSLVKARQVEPGSLLERISLRDDIDSLRKRLDLAYLKDIAANPGKDIARLDTKYRDRLTNNYLDSRGRSVDELTSKDLYERSEKEYYKTGIYGTTIDLLSNFATSGYYNEINDPEIREFYDSWVRDTGFIDTVTKVFHNLFKYNVCYILSALGGYEAHPGGISSIPGKQPNTKTKTGMKASVATIFNEFVKKATGQEMDFEKFSKIYNQIEKAATSSAPIDYTILDPKFIKYSDAGFFNASTITITKEGLAPLKALQKQIKEDASTVSKSAKEVLRKIPSKMKAAADEDKDYVFTDEEISVVFLRKDDFELFSKPIGSRAFDSFDYKEELKKADFATVDGIYNYILKVTVGDKDNPVTDMAVLESIAEAFNTPQKAFSIVWNHTLQIEKITASEVGSILGKAKYEPVENDIIAALGISRAIIDGSNVSSDGAILATKTLQSLIKAARKQVETWIYQEYRKVAKAAGFVMYPVVRWKETVINTDSDAVTKASFMQMLDRKAISLHSYMREFDLDFDTEAVQMEEELELINKGILQAGSPFQASPNASNSPTAPKAVTPSGDQGRPKAQPSTKKVPIDKTKTIKQKTKTVSPSQASSNSELVDSLALELLNLEPEIRDELLLKLLNVSIGEEAVGEIEQQTDVLVEDEIEEK